MSRSSDAPAEPRRGTAAEEEAYLHLVGERVRLERVRRGMSRKVLSQSSGVSERYLAELERGAGNASLLVLRQIAEAMSLKVADLASEDAERSIDLQLTIRLLDRLPPADILEARRMLHARFGRTIDSGRERIALIGLRGAGKTSLGRDAAKALHVPFIELDKEIEKASGMSYAEYVKQHLFDRAGMRHAHYCSETAVRRGKTSGYDFDAQGPIQKRPLSHQWPYAAGSLCMTVRDLVAWNEALHRTTTILTPASYREMIRPDTLNDGYRVGYAKGLALTPVLGHPSLHHGGGINGWTTENMYFPAESLSVVVFYNTAGPSGPGEAAEAIVDAVLGTKAPMAVPVSGDISRFRGTYAGRGRGVPQTVVIEVTGTRVEVVRGNQRRALIHVGNNTFMQGATKVVFGEEGGRIVSLRIDAGAGNNVLRRRS